MQPIFWRFFHGFINFFPMKKKKPKLRFFFLSKVEFFFDKKRNFGELFNRPDWWVANHDLLDQLEIWQKHDKNRRNCKSVLAKCQLDGLRRQLVMRCLVEHILIRCQYYPRVQLSPIFLRCIRSIKLSVCWHFPVPIPNPKFGHWKISKFLFTISNYSESLILVQKIEILRQNCEIELATLEAK